MIQRLILLTSAVLLVSIPPIAESKPEGCDREDFAVGYVEAYQDAVPLENPDEAISQIDTLAAGECQQTAVVDLLTEDWGKPIGYKVAATSQPVQQLIGSDRPLVGVLLEGSILPDGATIAIASGSRLMYEVDLLVKVASDEINQAETLLDVARNLEAVYPFIEVPDLMLPPKAKLTAPLLLAMNIGARWGVVGEGIPVEATPEFLAALGEMTVILSDESGQRLVEAKGSDILEHPFNSVLFLVQGLRDRGETLQAGDIISLGSFGRLNVAESGSGAIARYEGLPGGPNEVSVRFE